MKKNSLITLLIIVSILLTQCKKEKQEYIPLHNSGDVETREGEPQRLNPHDTDIDPKKPFYQGEVLEVIDAGGYTYIKIKEDLTGHKHDESHVHKDFWIVVERTPSNIGDVIRFQKELVTRNYTSKTLDRTFDEVMFASNVQRKVNK